MAMQVNQVFKTAIKIAGNGRQISNCSFMNKEGVLAANTNANQKSNQIHVSSQREYPLAAALPLPINIDPTETVRFSPQRSRDVCGAAISIYTDQQLSFQNKIDITTDNSVTSDPHVGSYDCNSVVSLNSCMQSNVPRPFGGMNKFSHLNMPGGQWEQGSKFTAQDLQASHYTNLRREVREDWDTSFKKGTFLGKNFNFSVTNPFNISKTFSYTNYRKFSLSCLNLNKIKNNITEKSKNEESMSRADKLKKAVKEYGSTVIIFHITISLTSLGICYGLVSSGLDVRALLEYLGWGDSALSGKIAAGASTFVVAYAIHKVFAPVRISITLGSTPFIVRYLRSKGILKPPKSTE